MRKFTSCLVLFFAGVFFCNAQETIDSDLNVNGKLFLNTTGVQNGTHYSYLNWFGHNLVIGTKTGAYAHNILNLEPGGSSTGPIWSVLKMFKANSETDHELMVQFHTNGNSFFNGGNLGIGTTTPSQKLSIEGNSTASIGLSILNTTYSSNQGTFFLLKTGDTYVVTDQRNVGLLESYNDLILSAAAGTDAPTPSIKFQTGRSNITGHTRMVIDCEGKVGIGTTEMGDHLLAVNGSIGARAIKVEVDNWSDYVFDREYALKPLDEVEQFITKNKHLQDVPSEAEVLESGVDLGQMNATLLQKIEELTLYIIQQNKRIDELEGTVQKLVDQ